MGRLWKFYGSSPFFHPLSPYLRPLLYGGMTTDIWYRNPSIFQMNAGFQRKSDDAILKNLSWILLNLLLFSQQPTTKYFGGNTKLYAILQIVDPEQNVNFLYHLKRDKENANVKHWWKYRYPAFQIMRQSITKWRLRNSALCVRIVSRFMTPSCSNCYSTTSREEPGAESMRKVDTRSSVTAWSLQAGSKLENTRLMYMGNISLPSLSRAEFVWPS